MKDWGIKVSKTGKDVMYLDSYGNNPDLVFSSKYDILKIAKTGSGSFSTGSSATIAHGLGYPGAYIVYLSTDNTNFYTYHGQIGGTSYIDSTNLVIAKDRDTTINYYYPVSDNDYGTEGSAGYYTGWCKVGLDTGYGDHWKSAMRFLSVTESSSITSAELGFYITSRTGGTVPVKTWGIDEDNTSDFGGNPWGRDKTTNFVENSNDGGISAGSRWVYGVTDIFKEITNRGGWSSGNAMGFIIEDNGTTGNNYFIDDSRFYNQNNSYLKVTKQAAVQTIYYKYVIFTNKLDSTKAL